MTNPTTTDREGWEKELFDEFERWGQETLHTIKYSTSFKKWFREFISQLLKEERQRTLKSVIEKLPASKPFISDEEIENVPFGAQQQERVIGWNFYRHAALTALSELEGEITGNEKEV